MKTLFSTLRRLALALLAAAPLVRAAATSDVVMQAMRDELARSTAQLQLENLEKPYFISYRVLERRSQGVAAEFGSTLNRGESRSRLLNVELRVGSPAIDNTNFQAGMSSAGSMQGGLTAQLSLDDDYTVLRRQIWLASDRAYKQAVELLSKKRAVLQNKTRTDDTPDFSPQEPATITDLHPGKPINLDQAEALARELSAVFRETPAVATSNVSLSASEETTRYLNSEGSTFVRSGFQVSVVARAATQADDGFALDDHFLLFRRSWETLPPKAELLAALRDLGARLTAQRKAALPEQYNGPVLFEGQAAAELFAQAFAPNLIGRHRPVTEGNMPAMLAGADNPFLDKLGARVLPDFLNVTDDPTRTELSGVPLLGDSRVDDEGVPTHPVSLVEKGRLKTLLVSRSPVRGVLKSTGSAQGSGPAPSNLLVTASDGLDDAALKAELLKLVAQRGKDYGVIVRRLGDPLLRTERTPIIISSSSGSRGPRIEPALLAVKVFPDGREEPLRNVEIAGVDAPTFKDILCAGREPHVLTIPFRAQLLGGGGIPVCSFAVPSLLFEDVTLKKPTGEVPQPPVAKHPFFAK